LCYIDIRPLCPQTQDAGAAHVSRILTIGLIDARCQRQRYYAQKSRHANYSSDKRNCKGSKDLLRKVEFRRQ
jgi:hypothetical protein